MYNSRERGQALLLVLVLLLMIMGVALAVASVSQDNSRVLTDRRTDEQLRAAAQAGIAQTKLELWDAYLAPRGGVAGAPQTYKDFLAGLPTPVSNGATTTLSALSLSGFGGTAVAVTRTVQRDDQADDTTYLVLTSTAVEPATGATRVVEEVVHMGGAVWEGYKFSLLSNNVNCIFCHARFEDVNKFYGNGAVAGKRARVGSLETLQLRPKSDSLVAGTMYVQGSILTKHGNDITGVDNLGLVDEHGRVSGDTGFDSTKLIGGTGGVQAVDFDATGTVIDPESIVDFMYEGDVPGANYYKNYPTDPALQIDGELPQTFPPVIPDDGAGDASLAGNRTPDDSEWSARISGMNGTISRGASGGAMFVGDSYTSSTFAGTETAYDPTGNPGQLGKSLVLKGTIDNPIVIDGKVPVDGDLVISGYVKGADGILVVRGNIYVVGDVIYQDRDSDGAVYGAGDVSATRVFGQGTDGNDNSLALVAGGNIVYGPYMKGGGNGSGIQVLPTETIVENAGDGPDSADAVPGDNDGEGFLNTEMPLFNRMEWSKTQMYVKAPEGDFGTTLTNDVTKAVVGGDGQPVLNSAYKGADYTPRYYKIGDGAEPPYMMIAPLSDSEPNEWDNENKVWVGREAAVGNIDLTQPDFATKADGSALPRKISKLDPSFMDRSTLQSLHESVEADREVGPYEVDSMLYTDNMIFGVVPKDSKGKGQMIVNGAIIAADTGLLVTGGGATNGNFNETSDRASTSSVGLDESLSNRDLNGDGDLTDVFTMQDLIDHRSDADSGATDGTDTWTSKKADGENLSTWDNDIVLVTGTRNEHSYVAPTDRVYEIAGVDLNNDGDTHDRFTYAEIRSLNLRPTQVNGSGNIRVDFNGNGSYGSGAAPQPYTVGRGWGAGYPKTNTFDLDQDGAVETTVALPMDETAAGALPLAQGLQLNYDKRSSALLKAFLSDQTQVQLFFVSRRER